MYVLNSRSRVTRSRLSSLDNARRLSVAARNLSSFATKHNGSAPGDWFKSAKSTTIKVKKSTTNRFPSQGALFSKLKLCLSFIFDLSETSAMQRGTNRRAGKGGRQEKGRKRRQERMALKVS